MALPPPGMIATRDLGPAFYAVMGIDRDAPPEYRSWSKYAQAPADEAWVYSCIRKIYQAGAGVPLRVYVKRGNDLIPSADEPSAEGDDLQALLDYANPVDMTGNDLRSYTFASYSTWGESYLRKVRGRFGGPPQELYWLRAPDMDPETPDGRAVSAWKYQPTQFGEPGVFDPRDVVPWRTVNLQNPLRGLSPLSAIASEVATGVLWAQRLSAAVANDSVPPGYWQIPAAAQFTKQDESLVRRTLRALRGPRNKGRTPVMPQGLEFKAISLNPQDAEMIATRKVSRMAVCAALGVPLVLAGDDEKSSVYANLRDAERVFWRLTLVPMLDSFADVLNNWLVPDFDPKRRLLKVAFDYSGVEALKPTLDVEWNMWIAAIYAQAVVPNQFIRHFKLGPDVPWGDRPVPRTQVAIRPDPASLPTGALPTLDPNLMAELPGVPEEVSEDPSSAAGEIRAWGKSLYRHPAVRAWIVDPSRPLAAHELAGGRYVGPTARAVIEEGLRRRLSAAVIADELEEVGRNGTRPFDRSAAREYTKGEHGYFTGSTPGGSKGSSSDHAPTAQAMADAIAASGGFSIDAHEGTSPTDGYMVAVDGHSLVLDSSTFLEDPAGAQAQISSWLSDNAEQFDQAGAHVGGWLDTESGKVVLDPSFHVADLNEAIARGVAGNQVAVWDVANGVEIPTGGTGGYKSAGGDHQARQAGLRDDEGRARRARGRDRGQDPQGPRGGEAEGLTVRGGQWTKGEHGYFTGSTAGGGLSADNPAVRAAAAANVASATAEEPAVTGALQGIADQNGYELNAGFKIGDEQFHTLDAKLKTEDSTARKIAKDAADAQKVDPTLTDAQAIAQAQTGLNDNLRYTVVGDQASYDQMVTTTSEQLQQAGYTPVQAKDFWQMNGQTGYAGVNTQWETPTGQRFEVQFHTQDSLETKEVQSHPFYEVQRANVEGSPAHDAATQAINGLWNDFRAGAGAGTSDPALVGQLRGIYPVVKP